MKARCWEVSVKNSKGWEAEKKGDYAAVRRRYEVK